VAELNLSLPIEKISLRSSVEGKYSLSSFSLEISSSKSTSLWGSLGGLVPSAIGILDLIRSSTEPSLTAD
jgi:hypothetical protein